MTSFRTSQSGLTTALAPTLFGLFILIATSDLCQAGEFRFRAREHYDQHSLTYNNENVKYQGFSNTINFWYEKPFDLSVGLAGGSLFGSARTDETAPNGIGETIQLYFLGVEAKYFPLDNPKPLFVRAGLYWSLLDSKAALTSQNGASFYAGAGWEFLAWSEVGIAPELGLRLWRLQGIEITTFNISLGVHFY